MSQTYGTEGVYPQKKKRLLVRWPYSQAVKSGGGGYLTTKIKMTEDIRLLADGPIMKEKAMRKEANVTLRERTSAPHIESHTNCINSSEYKNEKPFQPKWGRVNSTSYIFRARHLTSLSAKTTFGTTLQHTQGTEWAIRMWPAGKIESNKVSWHGDRTPSYSPSRPNSTDIPQFHVVESPHFSLFAHILETIKDTKQVHACKRTYGPRVKNSRPQGGKNSRPQGGKKKKKTQSLVMFGSDWHDTRAKKKKKCSKPN